MDLKELLGSLNMYACTVQSIYCMMCLSAYVFKSIKTLHSVNPADCTTFYTYIGVDQTQAEM